MKLKNILIIAMAIVTLGLVVACSDEVVAAKDNNVAYTQVLESNGAFEYNGTKYETLQLAFKAIADGKGFSDIKTIKVLRDVTGPGASISADKAIVLDLDGHTLTFIDVEKEALTAGDSVNLIVKNGSMSLFDTSNADLAVVKADGANSLTLEGVNINTAGQYAVVAVDTGVVVKGGSILSGDVLVTDGPLSITENSTLDGALDADDSHVSLGTDNSDTSTITGEINLKGSAVNETSFTTQKSTTVTGIVTAIGSEKSTTSADSCYVKLDIDNRIDGIDMTNGYIYVGSNGHATMLNVDDSADPAVSGNWYKAANGASAITVPEGSQVNVEQVICQVQYGETGPITYYGKLKEALSDEVNAGWTVKMLAEDAYDEGLNISFPVTIDLYGKNITSNLTSAYALTIKNTGSSIPVLQGNLTGTGTESGTGITVNKVQVAGNITSACSVTIENNSIILKADTLVDIYAPVVTVTNSKIHARIISAGDNTPATSVSITNSYGKIGKIYAEATNSTDIAIELSSPTTSGDALIIGDDSNSSEDVLIANNGKVVITKNTRNVQVYGNIVVSAGNLETKGIEAYGTVNVTGDLVDGTATTSNNTTVYANGSTFKGAVDVTGTATFYNSKLQPTATAALQASKVGIYGATLATTSVSPVYNITAEKTVTTLDSDSSEDTLIIKESTGYVGSLTANGNKSQTSGTVTHNYYSNIVIDNSTLNTAGTHTLFVGDVSAYDGLETPVAFGDVTIKGYFLDESGTASDVDSRVTVASIPYSDDVKTSYAVVTGDIGSDTPKVSTVSDGWTVSESPTPGYSTFNGNIYAGGAGSFNNSTFAAGDSEKTLNAGTLVINNSVFKDDGSNTSYYALTASGADYGNPSTSALEIITSTGSVASLTANGGGSIKVDNSGATDTLTVTGNVSASKTENSTTTYYDVTLVGKNDGSKNVIVNGTIDGNDIELTQTTVNGNVIAYDVSGDNGSVVATNSTVGNSSSEDVVFSRDIRISNSTVNVAKLIKGVEVVNEESTDVPADLIHLENVIGTVVEAKVAAASAVDYSANNAGTSTDPVYYAFYLKNAFTSGDYGDSYNFNINKVASAGGTGTSSTASEPDQTVQAVYINNANTVDRYINSAGVGETLSSIAATNGDVNVEIDSNGSSVISITGSIATTGSGNVVLKGKNSEKKITLKSSVTSAGSVTTSFCDFSPVSSGATAITSTLAYAATAPNGVVINNSTGEAGAITAASGVVINNSGITSSGNNLTTGAITAKHASEASYYDVAITGPTTTSSTLTIGNSTAGSILYAKAVTSKRAVFAGIVGGATLSETAKPVASLTDGTVSNNTYSNGSEFQGDVTATGAVVLYNSITKADVTSTTSISAYNATLGDGADDIFAPVVSITDSSKIRLNSIQGNGSSAATSVTITDPAKYSSTASSISSITTASLSVTADNDNLTVTSAEAEGAATINGGTFNKTALSGTTNINDGKFTDGTASVDHSLSGTTTISGGTFTGAVVLSGNKANSITGCSFYDNGSYGSFEYSGSGSLNISGGSFQGSTIFYAGTTTITGGSFGSSVDHRVNINSGATVYAYNFSNIHLAATNGVGATFRNGTVYVYEQAGLAYAGCHVSQTDTTQCVTIALGNDITLGSNVTLSSQISNLSLNTGSYTLGFYSGYSNYQLYLGSTTGNYTLKGTFEDSNTTSGTSTNSYIYYHLGAGMDYSSTIGSNVTIKSY